MIESLSNVVYSYVLLAEMVFRSAYLSDTFGVWSTYFFVEMFNAIGLRRLDLRVKLEGANSHVQLFWA
jgi:hypothetical protein